MNKETIEHLYRIPMHGIFSSGTLFPDFIGYVICESIWICRKERTGIVLLTEQPQLSNSSYRRVLLFLIPSCKCRASSLKLNPE